MRYLCGWSIEHLDNLRYESTGNVRITVKVQSYAEHYQKVIIEEKPESFRTIKKGENRFLVHSGLINKRGILEIYRKYRIYPYAFKMVEQKSWGYMSEIPKTLSKKYQTNEKYWPVYSEAIKSVSHEPWFKENHIEMWVKKAGEFLWSKIKNAEPQNERLGAEKAYRLGRGDCDEFTDLFITLARIRGLPARRVTGFYVNKVEEPHAWSEVYLPSGNWIPVDVAMNIIGEHTPRHVVMKIEEFNPSISEYRISWKGGKLKYTLVRNEKFEPIYC